MRRLWCGRKLPSDVNDRALFYIGRKFVAGRRWRSVLAAEPIGQHEEASEWEDIRCAALQVFSGAHFQSDVLSTEN